MIDEQQVRELAKTMSGRAIAAHLGLSRTTIQRFMQMHDIKGAVPVIVRIRKAETETKYADLADRAKEMHVSALARHYGVTVATMSKTLRKRGIVAAPPPKYIPRPNAKRATPYKLIPHATPFTDRRVKDTADLAAEHVQKDRPVFKCDENGRPNPKGKFYMCGRTVKTPDEIIAIAERKGWRRDDWARLVA